MTLKRHEIRYSEPVREIMGSPPGKTVRWGTAVIFIIFILFIFFAWLIRYPDIVIAPVEITTENPPAPLAVKTTGRIMHLLVTDRQKVTKGEVVAVMENPAAYSEIIRLRNFIDTFKIKSEIQTGYIPTLQNLGELQPYFETFCKAINDIGNFLKNDYYGAKINAVNEEIRALKIYIGKLHNTEKFYQENFLLEYNKFRRDSALNAGKSIAQAEYENSRQALIRQQIELQKIRLEISAKNIELINKKQLIEEYTIKRVEDQESLISLANEALKNLRANLSIWENTYLIISPVNGQITFSKYWSENQQVTKGEIAFSVVPENPGKYIGKIYLKMHKSGKVKEKQTVNIKLNAYPYMEYGMLQGIIRTKALVPSGDNYLIEVELKNGLTTLYNKTLDFTQNMTGIAEIITDDRSLLEKMIYPFRYLITRNL